MQSTTTPTQCLHSAQSVTNDFEDMQFSNSIQIFFVYYFYSQLFIFQKFFKIYVRPYHRIRINTKENAKVLATVCGTAFIQFLYPLAILHQFEEKDEIIIFLEFVLVENSYKYVLKCGKNLKNTSTQLKVLIN